LILESLRNGYPSEPAKVLDLAVPLIKIAKGEKKLILASFFLDRLVTQKATRLQMQIWVAHNIHDLPTEILLTWLKGYLMEFPDLNIIFFELYLHYASFTVEQLKELGRLIPQGPRRTILQKWLNLQMRKDTLNF
jgi:hypothetical protein